MAHQASESYRRVCVGPDCAGLDATTELESRDAQACDASSLCVVGRACPDGSAATEAAERRESVARAHESGLGYSGGVAFLA